MNSGKHQMTDHDAQLAIEEAWDIQAIEFTEEQETGDHREQYRRAVQTSKKSPATVHGGNKRKHDESSASHEGSNAGMDTKQPTMHMSDNQVQLEVPVEQWNTMNGMMQNIVRLR